MYRKRFGTEPVHCDVFSIIRMMSYVLCTIIMYCVLCNNNVIYNMKHILCIMYFVCYLYFVAGPIRIMTTQSTISQPRHVSTKTSGAPDKDKGMHALHKHRKT